MQSTSSEKIKKNQLKMLILTILTIFDHLQPFFLDFFKNVNWGFLHCIQCIKTLLWSYLIQHSDNFFRFFTLRGDPYDFGVVKSYTVENWLQKIPKKSLKDWTKWNRKIGGRNFHITSGALWGTLKHRSLQPDKAGGSARLET